MNIFVGNLSWAPLKLRYAPCLKANGKVERVNLVTGRDTERSRGFAFVEMPDSTEADRAIAGLNGADLDGRTMNVNAPVLFAHHECAEGQAYPLICARPNRRSSSVTTPPAVTHSQQQADRRDRLIICMVWFQVDIPLVLGLLLMAALMDLRVFKLGLLVASILLMVSATGVMVFGTKLGIIPAHAVAALSVMVWLACVVSVIRRRFSSKRPSVRAVWQQS